MKKIEKGSSRRLPARKLIISYLTIIMTMSIVFSSVFYVTSVNELDRRPVADGTVSKLQDPDHILDEWIGRRSDDNKYNLGVRLITLNIGALAIGGVLSYWLARRTLRPIEKALDEQDQFVADASHELRTPITSALLSNEIALKNSNLTLAAAKVVIEGNIKDMQELKQLSDELLRESDGELNKVKRTSVETHAVIDEAIYALQSIANRQNIIIKNETSTSLVMTDADRLRKVLVILIENAIKYSAQQSTVTVTSQKNKATLDITVADQGVGIDTTDLEYIFNRFYRADRSRSQTNGYGLGLSIAKKLLTEIGGEMSVTSALNIGSAFTVTLPSNDES